MSRQVVESSVHDSHGVQSETTVADRRWELSPGRVIGGIIGLGYAVIGAVGVIDAGLDDTLQEPIVSVFGLEVSAGVSLVLLGLGLLLVVAAASRAGEGIVGFAGALAIIAGVLGAAVTGDIRDDIGVTSGVSWFLIVTGIVCAVAAWIAPTYVSRRDVHHDRIG